MDMELIGRRACAVCEGGGTIVSGIITGFDGERITIDLVFVAQWKSVLLLQ